MASAAPAQPHLSKQGGGKRLWWVQNSLPRSSSANVTQEGAGQQGRGHAWPGPWGADLPPDTPVPPHWGQMLKWGWHWWPRIGWVSAGHCSDVHTGFGGRVPPAVSPQLCSPALWGSCAPHVPLGFAHPVRGACCTPGLHTPILGVLCPQMYPQARLCTPGLGPVPCHAHVHLLPDGFSVPRLGRFPGNLHTRRAQHLRGLGTRRGGSSQPRPWPSTPAARGGSPATASTGQPRGIRAQGAVGDPHPQTGGLCPTKVSPRLGSCCRGRHRDTPPQMHCKPH